MRSAPSLCVLCLVSPEYVWGIPYHGLGKGRGRADGAEHDVKKSEEWGEGEMDRMRSSKTS